MVLTVRLYSEKVLQYKKLRKFRLNYDGELCIKNRGEDNEINTGIRVDQIYTLVCSERPWEYKD